MIFVDTWAWLALAYTKDPNHPLALQQHRGFLAQRQVYITTDYVVSEVITTLFAAVEFEQARRFVEGLLQTLETGPHRLAFVTNTQFNRAWELRQRFYDRPALSFVDLTTMVVMQELGISEIFTGDRNFEQVGMGFQLFPRGGGEARPAGKRG